MGIGYKILATGYRRFLFINLIISNSGIGLTNFTLNLAIAWQNTLTDSLGFCLRPIKSRITSKSDVVLWNWYSNAWRKLFQSENLLVRIWIQYHFFAQPVSKVWKSFITIPIVHLQKFYSEHKFFCRNQTIPLIEAKNFPEKRVKRICCCYITSYLKIQLRLKLHSGVTSAIFVRSASKFHKFQKSKFHLSTKIWLEELSFGSNLGNLRAIGSN